jgi:hypothetical protein
MRRDTSRLHSDDGRVDRERTEETLQIFGIAGQHLIARLSQGRNVCVDDVAVIGGAKQQAQAFPPVQIQRRCRYAGQGPRQLSLACTVTPHLGPRSTPIPCCTPQQHACSAMSAVRSRARSRRRAWREP